MKNNLQTRCRSEINSWQIKLVCFLGLISLLKLTYPLLKWLITRSILNNANKRLKSYGSWAMVTGATDGIGLAFAQQLAKHGLNLILLSRNSTKLTSVSIDIKQEFPNIKIKTIPIDFSLGNISKKCKVIKEEINELKLGILINNVGITYQKAMFFHELDDLSLTNLLKVNLETTTWLTKSIIPLMLQRRRGAIVNISSGAAVVVPSHPLYAIYAATKAYVDKLSRCLHVEYKEFGIDVQCQVPLYVATKMASNVAAINRSSFFVPSPEDYAKSAVEQIGIGSRCTPYWSHSLQWFLAGFVPDTVLDSWRLAIGLRRRSLG